MDKIMYKEDWFKALKEAGFKYNENHLSEHEVYYTFIIGGYYIQLFDDEIVISHDNALGVSYFYPEVNLVNGCIMDGRDSWNHFILNLRSIKVEGENDKVNSVVVNNCYGGFGLSELAQEEIIKRKGLEFKDFTERFNYFEDIPRHDRDLVAVVEELGYKADGNYAELHVKEINSDSYYIVDNDGIEAVYTPETVDWIKIED